MTLRYLINKYMPWVYHNWQSEANEKAEKLNAIFDNSVKESQGYYSRTFTSYRDPKTGATVYIDPPKDINDNL